MTRSCQTPSKTKSDFWNPGVRNQADQVIDSSNTNIHQLRRQVWNFVDRRSSDMTIVLQSFAFKKGVPQDADFMFDARVLPNPHWQEELRALTGKDEAVQDMAGR